VLARRLLQLHAPEEGVVQAAAPPDPQPRGGEVRAGPHLAAWTPSRPNESPVVYLHPRTLRTDPHPPLTPLPRSDDRRRRERKNGRPSRSRSRDRGDKGGAEPAGREGSAERRAKIEAWNKKRADPVAEDTDTVAELADPVAAAGAEAGVSAADAAEGASATEGTGEAEGAGAAEGAGEGAGEAEGAGAADGAEVGAEAGEGEAETPVKMEEGVAEGEGAPQPEDA